MSHDHQAEITWSPALVEKGLPTQLETIAPAWFWDDQPRTREGWSLRCAFEPSPREQGNPSRARVRFTMDAAPHDRLRPGVTLRLFEPTSLQYATVRLLD